MGAVIGLAIGCIAFLACFFVALCKECAHGKGKAVHSLGFIHGQTVLGVDMPGLYLVHRSELQAEMRPETYARVNPAPMQKQVAERKR